MTKSERRNRDKTLFSKGEMRRIPARLFVCNIFFSLFQKMYDNIASLRFDVDSNGVKVAGAMVSAEGEVMELRKPIQVEGRVEEWMTGILLEMRRTNRLLTKEAIFHYCEDRSRCV